MSDDEIYRDDENHPIPRVDVCDVRGVLKTGGADLAIVIAKPLKDDLRSRQRLLRKFEHYLGFVASAVFAEECGVPSKQNTRICVHIHPDSDLGAFEFIEACRTWIVDDGARLEIIKRPNKAKEPRQP